MDCIYDRSGRFTRIIDGYTMTLTAYAFAVYNTTDERAIRAYTRLERFDSSMIYTPKLGNICFLHHCIDKTKKYELCLIG